MQYIFYYIKYNKFHLILLDIIFFFYIYIENIIIFE